MRDSSIKIATAASSSPRKQPEAIAILPKRPVVRSAPQDGHLYFNGFRTRKESRKPKGRLQDGQCMSALTFDMSGRNRLAERSGK